MKKQRKEQELSPTSRKLVDHFVTVTKWHGESEEHGLGSAPEKAKTAHEEAKSQLEARLLKLERELRILRKVMRNPNAGK